MPLIPGDPEPGEPGSEAGQKTAELLAELESDDPGRRHQVALRLAERAECFPVVCHALVREPAVEVRHAFFSGLIRLGNENVVEFLVGLLRSEDPGLRSGAVDALTQMPQLFSAQLEDLIRDPDGDVRLLAINVLEGMRHPDVPKWLHRVLEDEEDVNICAAAINAMAGHARETDIPLLEAVRARFADSPFVRFSVNAVLSEIGR